MIQRLAQLKITVTKQYISTELCTFSTSDFFPEYTSTFRTHWTTKTIFQYFSNYGPSKVEWLNDSSCNVVFPDTYSCKRALTFLSLPLEVELKRMRDENPEVAQRSDAEFLIWRKGKTLEVAAVTPHFAGTKIPYQNSLSPTDTLFIVYSHIDYRPTRLFHRNKA